MARKIALRTATLARVNGSGADTTSFSYAEMMTTILRFAPPGKGLVLDDVIKTVAALKPIEEATQTGADHVTFSEEAWRTLRERLDQFPFAIADQAIAEFGLAIRNAPEIT